MKPTYLLEATVFAASTIATLLILTAQSPAPDQPYSAGEVPPASPVHAAYIYPAGWRYCRPHTGPSFSAMADAPPKPTVLRDSTSGVVGDPDPSGARIPPPAWTLAAQQWGCGQDAMGLLIDAGERYGVDPALLVCLARYESGFNIHAVNRSSGCAGLLQVSPLHKKAMRRCGLEWTEEGRLAFACKMIVDARRNGKSIYAALRPWAVRHKAYALYTEMIK